MGKDRTHLAKQSKSIFANRLTNLVRRALNYAQWWREITTQLNVEAVDRGGEQRVQGDKNKRYSRNNKTGQKKALPKYTRMHAALETSRKN